MNSLSKYYKVWATTTFYSAIKQLSWDRKDRDGHITSVTQNNEQTVIQLTHHNLVLKVRLQKRFCCEKEFLQTNHLMSVFYHVFESWKKERQTSKGYVSAIMCTFEMIPAGVDFTKLLGSTFVLTYV